MKRKTQQAWAVPLFSSWAIMFFFMQFFSFEWSDQDELRSCLLIAGFFLLQLLVIKCLQVRRFSWSIVVCAVIYGIAFVPKDLCLALVVFRPNWQGPRTLVFSCLVCDLAGLAICRQHYKMITEKTENAKKTEAGF